MSNPTYTLNGVEVVHTFHSGSSRTNPKGGQFYNAMFGAFHFDGRIELIYESDTCGIIRFFGDLPSLATVHKQADNNVCFMEYVIHEGR